MGARIFGPVDRLFPAKTQQGIGLIREPLDFGIDVCVHKRSVDALDCSHSHTLGYILRPGHCVGITVPNRFEHAIAVLIPTALLIFSKWLTMFRDHLDLTD